MISTSKVAEYKLAAGLLERGLLPLWPSTAECSFDLAVASATRILRVQVKGTDSVGPVVQVTTQMKQGSRRVRYTKKDVDVMAIYVTAEDLWYFIPVKSTHPMTTRIKPFSTKCRWSRYRNAWRILGAP